MWGIKAVFLTDRDDSVLFTFYDEIMFETEQEAIEAINDSYGETLSEAASLDCDIDDELEGYYLEDLEPYKIGEEPWNNELA